MNFVSWEKYRKNSHGMTQNDFGIHEQSQRSSYDRELSFSRFSDLKYTKNFAFLDFKKLMLLPKIRKWPKIQRVNMTKRSKLQVEPEFCGS